MDCQKRSVVAAGDVATAGPPDATQTCEDVRRQGERMMTDDETTVRRLLAAVGIDPPDDEVDEMVKSYPGLRAAADSLYTTEAERFVPANTDAR